MKTYIAYYRVSTAKQGQSGLGLEAQKQAVARFANDGSILSEFTDIESGTKKGNNRPQLATALKAAKETGAMLLIAKLDRLSRNMAFISQLMESGVNFTACDMPTATKLTIHIFAAMAEHEAEMISKRTKAALAAKKERGEKVGNPANFSQAGRAKGAARMKAKAAINPNTQKAAALISALRKTGESFPKIAKQLNEAGFKTARGGNFQTTQVMRVYKRFCA